MQDDELEAARRLAETDRRLRILWEPLRRPLRLPWHQRLFAMLRRTIARKYGRFFGRS